MSSATPVKTVAEKPRQPAGANLVVQRKCACGAEASSLTGECAQCSKKKMGLQAKRPIDEPGDVYEREADRIAGQVLPAPASPDVTSPPPRIQRYTGQGTGQAGSAPASVDHALAGPGRPLDPALREDMEQRFRHDFSRVRAHTGAAAARAADDLEARAFTHGRDIVFARHEYEPASVSGKRLLGHELVHVAQQAQQTPSSTGAVQRQPKPKPKPKFYQPVIDALARVPKPKQNPALLRGPIDYHEPINALEVLLALCEAVEVEQKLDIPDLLNEFVTAAISYPAEIEAIDPVVFHELGRRMFDLGLGAESEELFRGVSVLLSRFDPTYIEAAETAFLRTLVERTVAQAQTKTPEQMRATLLFMLLVFVPLRNKMVALGTVRSHSQGLEDLLFQLIRSFQTVFQALLDYAANEFASGSGKGKAALKIASEVLARMRDAVFPADLNKRIDAVKLDITRTKIIPGTKGRGVLYDVFAKGPEAKRRELEIYAYDPAAKDVPELQSSLAGLYRARVDQVETMARIYGAHEFDPFSADRNAEVIERMPGGRMRLNSDEDWRTFVLEKYRFMTSAGRRLGGKADVLDAIIELLFAYLRAFTQHAHHVNVYDIGSTSYLNRDFPRALTGKLLHDCGVYAVRVAYILSLVRKELGLRFRFVTLPVHIALVIEGDGLPTYIVQNEEYRRITPKDMGSMRANWDAFDVTGTPGTPKDEAQFQGELVSADFIPGPLDMPFRTEAVAAPTGSAPPDRAKLWSQYQTLAPKDVFEQKATRDPKNQSYQFDLKYLSFSKASREVHNDEIVPYWNVEAPKVWFKFWPKPPEKAPRAKKAQPAPAAPLRLLKASKALALLSDFKKEHEAIGKPMFDALDAIDQSKRGTSSELRSDPTIVARGARISHGERAGTLLRDPVRLFRERIDVELSFLGTRPPDEQVDMDSIAQDLDPPFLTDVFLEPME